MSQRLRSDGILPLSQLDLNQVQNVSHIPQMSSGLKRTSGRASGRQSMIGAPRTNVLQMNKRSSTTGISELVQQSVSRSGKRKSLGGLNSVSRTTNRVSSFGLGSIGPLSQSKDPRPLRDRNFQQTIQQEIFDFLLSNNFEMEMKHPISTKSLKNPTQKDFVVIFQFLYKKVDPGYRFTKSIEHEVYYVLKSIKYPYLESINKSQISAVGGQNWPVFLGILHWLVELLGKIESITNSYPNDRSTYDSTENNEVEVEKIFFNYIIQSYNAFLNNVDDYSNFFNEMESEYAVYLQDIVTQTEQLQKENLNFRDQYQKLLSEAESLNSIEKKSEALESDLFKFKAYIESMENRKQRWGTVVEQIKQEMVNSEMELERTEEEKNQIQKKISDQGLTPNDIDRMNNERDRVSKSLDAVNQRLNEISRIVHSKEHEAQQAYEVLLNTVKEYNYNVYTITSTSTDIDASNYVVKLDNLMSEERLGLRPEALLDGQDLKSIRINLQDLKNKISSMIHQAQDEGLNYQEKIDSLNESINERSETIESLEAKLSAGKLEYEELYETMNKDATSYHTEIERLENELKNMQSESKQHILLLDQHSKTIDMEYNKLLSYIQQEREILHAKVQQMIETVITLKINVQNSLDDLDSMTLEVLEKEKAEK